MKQEPRRNVRVSKRADGELLRPERRHLNLELWRHGPGLWVVDIARERRWLLLAGRRAVGGVVRLHELAVQERGVRGIDAALHGLQVVQSSYTLRQSRYSAGTASGSYIGRAAASQVPCTPR